MDQSFSKNFNFDLIQDFAGYVSARDKTNVAQNVFVKGSQNIYKKLSGTLSVREGMKRRGAANTTVSPISSEFIWNTSWGATYPLMISDNNLWVEYNLIWYSLLSGLTKTRYVFDKWYEIQEGKDRVLFVNGTSDLFHWSGGIATIASVTANTLTKQDNTTTWKQVGFTNLTAGEKKIMIGGIEYTYTGGETTTTLTGVTPDPTAGSIVAGEIAIQSVQTATNTPTAGFKADFLKVINNQAYIGSYSCRLCWISSSTDFTDFTVPTPRVPGDPELLTMDGSLKGFGVRGGNAFISYGSGEWAKITFQDVTVGTTLTQKTVVDVTPVSKLGAAYAHEFIGNSGDNIIYLAQDQQVRSVGNFNNLFTTGYPSLSQEVNTELSQENFNGGGIKCIGDFVYVTAPISGKVYLYQSRETLTNSGNVVAERLWHSPMTWGATRIDEIGGITYAFSNANPQIYQIWNTEQWHDDSPSDENLPYACILAFSYRNVGNLKGGNRAFKLKFEKNYTEGYIATGTNLNLIMNYEYQGSKNVLTAPINSSTRPATLYGGTTSTTTGSASLGDESLGDIPLGDGISEAFVDDLSKFRTINNFNLDNVFEYQPIYQSDQADARWEILATGTNVRASELEPTEIINK